MAQINLRQMAVNQQGVIAAVKADGELGRRIRDMGLVPGTEFSVRGRAQVFNSRPHRHRPGKR